jgi:hypothetical protein
MSDQVQNENKIVYEDEKKNTFILLCNDDKQEFTFQAQNSENQDSIEVTMDIEQAIGFSKALDNFSSFMRTKLGLESATHTNTLNFVQDLMNKFLIEKEKEIINFSSTQLSDQEKQGKTTSTTKPKAKTVKKLEEKTPTSEKTTEKKKTIKKKPTDELNVTVVSNYTGQNGKSTSCAVVGNDTFHLKKELLEYGGRFNKFLKIEGEDKPGYIIPKDKLKTVMAFLKTKKNVTVDILESNIKEEEPVNEEVIESGDEGVVIVEDEESEPEDLTKRSDEEGDDDKDEANKESEEEEKDEDDEEKSEEEEEEKSEEEEEEEEEKENEEKTVDELKETIKNYIEEFEAVTKNHYFDIDSSEFIVKDEGGLEEYTFYILKGIKFAVLKDEDKQEKFKQFCELNEITIPEEKKEVKEKEKVKKVVSSKKPATTEKKPAATKKDTKKKEEEKKPAPKAKKTTEEAKPTDKKSGLKLEKNTWGNEFDKKTGIVFLKLNKVYYPVGTQDKASKRKGVDSIKPLTPKDKELCKKNAFKLLSTPAVEAIKKQDKEGYKKLKTLMA